MGMGNYIKTKREALAISQAELARMAEISQPSLHAIEGGKTKDLKCSTLVAIADALKVSPLTILTGVDPEAALKLDSLRMETELTRLFRSLNGPRRLSLLEYARFLLEAQPKSDAPLVAKVAGKLHQIGEERPKAKLK